MLLPPPSGCRHDTPRQSFGGKLLPLLEALEIAAPALLKEYRRLKRKGLLTADEDCIQQPSGRREGKWRRYEISAVWQQLNGTTCSATTSPTACALLAQLRALGATPVLRAGYSVVEPRTWIRPHFGASNAQLNLHLGLSGCNSTLRVFMARQPSS
eukprot:COSAG05_NODE_4156_length_1650_cov_1.038040_3_plen_156_part_00